MQYQTTLTRRYGFADCRHCRVKPGQFHAIECPNRAKQHYNPGWDSDDIKRAMGVLFGAESAESTAEEKSEAQAFLTVRLGDMPSGTDTPVFAKTGP